MSASTSAASAQTPTTASQDAFSHRTLAIVADVPDRSPSAAASAAVAEVALDRLVEISADLRGAAILDSTCEVLAATSDPDAWQSAGQELRSRRPTPGRGEPLSQAHVGTEEGEVFAVRQGRFTVVAAADRFALGGLMLFDIRSVLRDMTNGDQDAAGAAEATAEAA